NAVVAGILVRHTPNNAAPVPDIVRLDFGVWHPAFSTVNAIIFLAVLQLLIFALIAFLSTARNITQQLLQNAVSMRIQLMVMEKAASLDLAFYEDPARSEEHTSELQSRENLVCRLLLEKKKKKIITYYVPSSITYTRIAL